MPTNHKPNLSRESMPWARDIERQIEELTRNLGAVRTGSLANNKAVSAATTQGQIITAAVGAQGAALAENDAKLAELEGVTLPALDTDLGNLATDLGALDQELGQIDSELVGVTGDLANVNDVALPSVRQWINRVAASNTNVISDPQVTDPALWDTSASTWSVDMTMGRTTPGSLKRTGAPGNSSVLVLRGQYSNSVQMVSVLPGEVWEVSAWAWVDDQFNGTASNSKLRLADQSNNLRTAPVAPNVVRNQWVEVKSRYTIPATGVSALRLTVVGDNTAGTIWWTDFSLRNVTADQSASEAKAEINTLKTVTIPGLNTDLTTERGRINTLIDSTIPGLNTDLGVERARITTLTNTTIPQLNTDLTTERGRINTLVNTTIPVLNTDLATERQRITDNKLAVDAAISTANGKITTAQGQLDTLNTTTLPNLNANLTAQGIKADSAAALAASKGRTWSQAATPPEGTTYSWEGTAHQTMSIKRLDGVETARNMHINPGGNGSAGYSTYSGGTGNGGSASSPDVTWSKSGKARRMTWTAVALQGGDLSAIVRPALDAVGPATEITAVINWRVGQACVVGAPSAYSGSGGIVSVSRSRTGEINAVPGVTYTDWVTFRSTNTTPPTYDGNTRIVLGQKPTAVGHWVEMSDVDIYPGQYSQTRQWFYGETPDDRAYDLWIDETGAANTPKRWNGTAWVSAQDKAASDANNLVQGWRATGKTTIDGGKIEADSVTAGQIATNAITANELAANAVYAGAIQANAVTANAIKAGEITAAKMVAGTITAVSGILADAVITEAKIADLAVTNAKINDLSAAKITTGFLAADRIASNSLDASKITAGTITTDRMTANTISGDRIAANTLDAAKIVAGSITTDRMTANSINGDRIVANTLDAAKIVAGSITTDRMTANSINGDRITANTLNAAKIVSGTITTDLMTVGTINGDRITVNTLGADRIIARSITADRIGANQITANEIKAGTITAAEIKAGEITANLLAADAITGKTINGGTITGTTINGGTINGTLINSVEYTGDGATFRKAGAAEYAQLAGDKFLFKKDGRTLNLGAVDAQLDTDGTSGVMYLFGYDAARVSWLGAGIKKTRADNTFAHTDVYAREAVFDNLRVATEFVPPTGRGPFRNAAGNANYVGGVPAGGTYSFTINFPSGRFTQPPVVTASASRSRISVGIVTVTNTSFTVLLENWSGGNEPADFVIRWQAVQMTSSSGVG